MSVAAAAAASYDDFVATSTTTDGEAPEWSECHWNNVESLIFDFDLFNAP